MTPVVSIFTGPYSVGENMGGIGIRMHELAEALGTRFHTRILAPGAWSGEFLGVDVLSADTTDWRALISESDTVIFTDLADPRMMLYAYEKRKQIVVENAVPFEHLQFPFVRDRPEGQAWYRACVDLFRLQTLIADMFIARSEVERVTLLSALALEGRLGCAHIQRSSDLSHLITSIPIGYGEGADLRLRRAEHGTRQVDLLWNGGVWEFCDPTVILDALQLLRREGRRCSLHFMYPPPPTQRMEQFERLRTAVQVSGLSEQVTIANEAPSHVERDSIVAAARVLVMVGQGGIENSTCHRLRMRDVFLYGKPILIDDAGASGRFVSEMRIGAAVPPTSRDFADAIRSLLWDSDHHRERCSNIARARERFCYARTTRGLADFIDAGANAIDRDEGELGTRIERLVNMSPQFRNEPLSPL